MENMYIIKLVGAGIVTSLAVVGVLCLVYCVLNNDKKDK